MNTNLSHAVLPFLLTAVTASAAYAQGDERLHGTWKCVEGSEQGDTVTLAERTATIAGHQIPLSVPQRGVMLLGPAGQQERLDYQFRGDQLVVDDGLEKTVWSKQSPGPNPPDRPTDPFGRTFRGEGIQLELERTPLGSYAGTLTFGQDKFPVRAKAKDNTLTGSFRSGDRDFGFEASLEGDRLTLTSDGEKFVLTGEPIAKPAPKVEIPRTHTIAKQAKVAFAMPQGFQLMHQDGDGAAILPPAKPGQAPSVTFSFSNVALSAEERQMSIRDMVSGGVEELRQSLRNEAGLIADQPTQGPEEFEIGGVKASSVSMRVRTQDGREGMLWYALKTIDGRAMVGLMIALDGQAQTVAPAFRDTFGSLLPLAD